MTKIIEDVRAVAIGLKIPDNTAYTALVALRRLGVKVARVERSEIRLYRNSGDASELAKRVKSDETVFNPNKHLLAVLDDMVPRAGEVWIVPLDDTFGTMGRATAWRLIDEHDGPVERSVLDAAIERLLCNPAIERAVTGYDAVDRDNPLAGE